MALPPEFEARLVGVRALTPRVRELVFERVDGQRLDFIPGQWVRVQLPLEGDAAGGGRRAYSIASAPRPSPRFEIAVTRVDGGPGSTWLHGVASGAVLRFQGPQGFFMRPVENAPPSLLIATGTGVTPFRSMLRAALDARSDAGLGNLDGPRREGAPDPPFWLLFGARLEDDILYADEFRAAAQEFPFVRFVPTLSQPDPTRGWAGRRGYVQAHVRDLWAELAGLVPAPHAFICGLERMVGSVRDVLRAELGVART